ncbi:hypothetical protein [Arcanobacterium phocae]|uniref:hypothetical protein n=1 Tax=Arcanobacterium phocae TaxID=131112 RepID=UPI001C0EDF07|nr:hypothetical protein [Arcanobacterium phocae]
MTGSYLQMLFHGNHVEAALPAAPQRKPPKPVATETGAQTNPPHATDHMKLPQRALAHPSFGDTRGYEAPPPPISIEGMIAYGEISCNLGEFGKMG